MQLWQQAGNAGQLASAAQGTCTGEQGLGLPCGCHMPLAGCICRYSKAVQGPMTYQLCILVQAASYLNHDAGLCSISNCVLLMCAHTVATAAACRAWQLLQPLLHSKCAQQSFQLNLGGS